MWSIDLPQRMTHDTPRSNLHKQTHHKPFPTTHTWSRGRIELPLIIIYHILFQSS